MFLNFLFSFKEVLDRFVEIAEGKEYLIILLTAFMCFWEAILPMLPLIAIVNFSIALLRPLCGTFLGITLALGSSVIGSVVGYFTIFILIKTSFSQKFIKKIENSPKVKKAVGWVSNRSDTFMILLLANPYTPSSIVNYSMGLVGYDSKRYLKIVLIGKMICITFLGLFGMIFNIGSDLMSFVWVILAYGILYLITLVIKNLIERKKKNYEEDDN